MGCDNSAPANSSAGGAGVPRRYVFMHSPFDSENAPFAWNTFERMTASVTKAQAGPRHQILDRTRHQHFACTGKGRDASTDVNSNSADIIAHHFAFACTSMPRPLTSSAIAHAHRTPRAGPSKVASTPSPVILTSRPRNLERLRRITA